MKQLFILSVLFFLFYQGFTQEKLPKLKIGIFGAYATYSFDNLKNSNQEVIHQLPFDAAVIDDFPAQIYFGGHVLVQLSNWYSLGPEYEYHSTGSRVGAKDYSGSYHFDQIVSSHQLGIENELRISKTTVPAVYLDFSGGVHFSSWKMEEVLNVTDLISDDRTEFAAIKPYLLPAIKISYPVYSSFSLIASAGYLFDLGGKYHLAVDRNYKSAQKIPWNGIRISLGIEFQAMR